MNKKYFFIALFLFSFLLHADEILESKKLFKLHINENEVANIYKFNGTPNKFTLKGITTNIPRKSLMKKIKLIDDNDLYAIKIFNNENKYLYSIGIGNPFYAHATHIGYEDSNVMGGPIDSNIVEISIPTSIEPSYFVISKRNNIGLFDDIQKILLP